MELLEIRTLLAVTIPGTFDFFITDPGDTSIDLGTDPGGDNPPLPAGFFGDIGGTPSDPFMQAGIPLEGNPPVEDFMRFPPPLVIAWVDQHGNVVGPDSVHKVNQILVPEDISHADTVVRRIDDAVFNAPGDAPTVDIEIVALSLESVQPIVVTYGGAGTKLWDVFVTLDETAVQPVGSIDLMSTTFVDGVSVSGSVDNLDLPVAFKVTFEEVNNPGNTITVPSTLANPTPPIGLPPTQFTNPNPGSFSFPVGTVVAEKSDRLVNDVDGDGVADPGDTVEYAVGIGNFTGDDLTNVKFSDTLVDSTLVGGSINVSPLAVDDSYMTLGNIEFDSAALGAPSLLDNDREFLTHTLGADTVITNFDTTSANGGTVDVSGLGTFTYNPPINFSGEDTFTYTLTDPGGLTGVGTVTIDVVRPVWFVDANNGSDANPGTFALPFQTLGPLNGAGGAGDVDDVNETIFILDDGGANTLGPIELENGQDLLGQGVDLRIGSSTLVPGSPAQRPTIQTFGSNAIDLAQNNTVRGLNVDVGGGRGINGTNVGTFTLRDVDIFADNGGAIALGQANLDVSGGTLTVSNIGSSGEDGVSIELGSGDMHWQSFNGTDNIGGGINISNSSATFTFDSIDSIGTGTTGINLDNNDNGTFQVTGGTNLSGIDAGIDIRNSAGYDVDFGGQLTISNIGSSGQDGVRFEDNPGSTIDINGGVDIETDGGGFGFFGSNTGTINITGGIRSVNVNGGPGIFLGGSNAGASGGNFGDVTVSGGAADDGINLNSNTGTFTFDDLDITTTGGGRGLFASSSGTVNVTGGTVNSGTGRGIDIDGTNLGISLQSVSSNGADTGINLSSVTGSFSIVGDGGSVANGAGGTIQNTSGTGVTITGAEVVNLNQLFFIAPNFDAVSSMDVADLTIANTQVLSGGQNGFAHQATGSGPPMQTVRWTGNAVESQFTPFFASSDSPLLNVQAIGNLASPLSAAFGLHGLFLSSNAAGAGICADLVDNSGLGTLGTSAIGLNQQFGTGAGFGLVGLTAPETDPFAIAAFVQSQNPGASGVQVNVDTQFDPCMLSFPLAASSSATGSASGNASGDAPASDDAAASEQPPSEDQSSTSSVVANADQSSGLTLGALSAIADAAIDRWEATGLSAEQSAALRDVSFEVIDLPGWYIGTVTGNQLSIDIDAGGHGWFIDGTPEDDSEFDSDQSPAGMDLLTTVMHELGHVLGLEHSGAADEVMNSSLVAGVRRVPSLGQAQGADLSGPNSTGYIGAPIILGTLPAGKTLRIVFDAVIDTLSPGQSQIQNQGLVTADGGISVPTDDPATATAGDPTITQVPQADLQITKTDSADPVSPGASFSYTVTVTNNGPDAAADVLMTDLLPPGVTWVSDDGPNVAPTPARQLIFDVGTLASGATVVWTINVVLNAGVTATQTNTVMVGSTTHDPDNLNNAVTESTNAPAQNQPPVVQLSNRLNQILESEILTNSRRVANVKVVDDGVGSATLSLSGPDASFFEFQGNEVHLKAGTTLDFETKPIFNINVEADDPTIPGSPDSSVGLALRVLDVFEPPEINVLVSGVNIPDRGIVNFGDHAVAGPPPQRTLIVENEGVGDLVIQPATIPAGFTLIGPNFAPNTSLPPGGTASITLEMDTSTAGVQSGILTLGSNDSDEPNYRITLSGAVLVSTINPTPIAGGLLIDNGDTGFFDSGGWNNVTGFGFDADALAAAGNDGARRAIWAFGGLTPGQFDVSLTWLFGSDRAEHVPVVVRDGIGGPILSSLTVDQRIRPVGPSVGGRPFEILDQVNLAGDTLIVELSNLGAPRAVIADAVLITPFTPPPGTPEITVRRGGRDVADGSRLNLGSHPVGSPGNNTIVVRNDGTADLILQPVSVTGSAFTIGPNFAPNTIVPSGGQATFGLNVDTSTAGVFNGTLEMNNNDGDENPFNLQLVVDVRPQGAATALIDDGDTGFALTGNWTNVPGFGFARDAKVMPSNSSGTATWTFTGLAAGDYRVSTTWLNGRDRWNSVPYTIRDGVGGPVLAVVPVDQTVAPSGPIIGNRPFSTLGTVTLAGTDLAVVVDNTGAAGHVIADAIRIELLTPPPTQPEITVSQAGVGVADEGRFPFGSAPQGGPPLTRIFTVENQGTSNLILEPLQLSGSNAFRLASPNFTPGQVLTPGSQANFTVELDTAAVDSYFASISFANNDSDENPFNFDVDGKVTSPQPAGVRIIDNGDSGFSAVGNFTPVNGFGFAADALAGNGVNGVETAQWVFDNLTPGTTHEVSTTWLRGSDREAAVTYVIRDGVGGAVLSTVVVDQTKDPTGGVTAGGRPFQVLDIVTISGSQLVVELSTAGSTKAVIADAVRIAQS